MKPFWQDAAKKTYIRDRVWSLFHFVFLASSPPCPQKGNLVWPRTNEANFCKKRGEIRLLLPFSLVFSNATGDLNARAKKILFPASLYTINFFLHCYTLFLPLSSRRHRRANWRKENLERSALAPLMCVYVCDVAAAFIPPPLLTPPPARLSQCTAIQACN